MLIVTGRQPYLSIKDIEAQIAAFLAEISLPDRFHKWAAQRLERSTKQMQQDFAARKESLLRAQAASVKELENLTKLRIRDLLSDGEYVKERQDLERKQIGFTQKLDALARQAERFEPLAKVFLQPLLDFSLSDGESATQAHDPQYGRFEPCPQGQKTQY